MMVTRVEYIHTIHTCIVYIVVYMFGEIERESERERERDRDRHH
jgi:hypothetical protein